MAAKYYVAIRPQTNEHHAVHKEDCPFLPDDEKRIYLGMFGSGMDAIEEGQRHFPRTTICRFCLKEHLSEKNMPEYPEADITGIILTDNQIAQYQKDTMFYFLN
ncbi:MAG: hypothetical protein ABSA76_15325 [Bacteroidales bacterium]